MVLNFVLKNSDTGEILYMNDNIRIYKLFLD